MLFPSMIDSDDYWRVTTESQQGDVISDDDGEDYSDKSCCERIAICLSISLRNFLILIIYLCKIHFPPEKSIGRSNEAAYLRQFLYYGSCINLFFFIVGIAFLCPFSIINLGMSIHQLSCYLTLKNNSIFWFLIIMALFQLRIIVMLIYSTNSSLEKT